MNTLEKLDKVDLQILRTLQSNGPAHHKRARRECQPLVDTRI